VGAMLTSSAAITSTAAADAHARTGNLRGSAKSILAQMDALCCSQNASVFCATMCGIECCQYGRVLDDEVYR